MKKLSLLSLLMMPFIASCEIYDFVVEKIKGPHNEQKSEDKKDDGDGQPEPPIYVIWDKNKVDNFVKEGLGIYTPYSVPAYDKCIDIEYDDSSALLEGYFGLYIDTEFEECELLYSEILEANNWILKEKTEDFCFAFSPDYSLMLEYVYEPENCELVIYVTYGALVDWPTNLVKDSVANLMENVTAVIPEFEAEVYQVTYYDFVDAVAINGYGPDETIMNDYKAILEQEHWYVFDKGSDTFGAISENEQLRIDFYFNQERNEFNVDVFAYVKPVKNWPYDEIKQIIEEIGATGTVLPFTYENSGFTINDFSYYSVDISVGSVQKAQELAALYNQDLVKAGYEEYLYYCGDITYMFPGTTLCYRAAQVLGPIVSIELFSKADIDQYYADK